MEKQIKKYFTVEELCRSTTAVKYNISNIPTKEIIQNLEDLINNLLQPLRERYGKPIIVTSGYRCKELNKRVGGVINSQHIKGEAADIICKDKLELKELFEICKLFEFDQLIWEGTWIHISYRKGKNRRQILYKG